jgi:hypothetical protein
MVSSARTMRSWERSWEAFEAALGAAIETTLGRFAATWAGFVAGVRGPLPAGLLLGFLGMSEVPENAAFIGPDGAPQGGQIDGLAALQLEQWPL